RWSRSRFQEAPARRFRSLLIGNISPSARLLAWRSCGLLRMNGGERREKPPDIFPLTGKSEPRQSCGAFCLATNQGDRMRFLLYGDLRTSKGIPYSDRQLKRLEAKGTFPKRVAIAGGSIKGWPEVVIDEHISKLAAECRNGTAGTA